MIRNSIDLTEAVEAAAEGFCADLVPPVTLDNLSAIQRHVVREQALSYVTHALPHIARQVREQVVGTLRGQSIWLGRPKDEGETQTAFTLRLVASQNYSDAADLIKERHS